MNVKFKTNFCLQYFLPPEDLSLEVKSRDVHLILELLGEEDWDSVVKYRHVNKEKK